ncbi:MAG: precorrin-6y C5,15-methyltransferase (decarboxylating) subunit CbiE [Hyphomicrobiales bacterium]|jgi:precorrin-6B C5,15-methyltransferase / cobalt-precorrin-6B C5,C15-methyltransferase|nr:precorrin-6y C5,15-methyltransferase (decarboxylating) subunit CbiE [Hyphomicrobiales bacterium]
MNKKIKLIGIGDDGFDSLSQKVQLLILDADIIIGGIRHLSLLPDLKAQKISWSKNLRQDIEKIKKYISKNVCILASGDPLFYGIGRLLLEYYPISKIEVIPSPSCLSLCCARIGHNIKDIEVVSLHGREFDNIIKYIQPNNKIFVISHDRNTPKKIISLLKELRFENSTLYIFENIGGKDEFITKKKANKIIEEEFSDLNSILIECIPNKHSIYYQNFSGISDHEYENDGQITKSEIRSITISKLEPMEQSILWDIGGGSGSVSIEWSKIHKNTTISIVEVNINRIKFIKNNIKKFGVNNISVLHASVPEILCQMDRPNRIFIGGGLASSDGLQIIEESIDSLLPSGILVANGVTTETEILLIDMYKKHGGELLKHSTSNIKKIGNLHAWDQKMQVTQWKYIKE